MRSYVLLLTKMWDFIQYRPTLYPTIPPKKAVAKKGYLHLHMQVLVQKQEVTLLRNSHRGEARGCK